MITGTLPQTITEDNMSKTFQVPVWFNVQAETQQEAWEIVSEMMGMHVDYVVEEPVEIGEND